MTKKNRKPAKKSRTPIRCQCEEKPVKHPASLLKKVQCTVCGKIFRTNKEETICFDCEKDIMAKK